MKNVPKEILNLPVEGLHLKPGKLVNQLSETGTLLVFLRHFG